MNETQPRRLAVTDPGLRHAIEHLPALLQQDDLFRLSQIVRATTDYSRSDMVQALVDDSLPSHWRFGALYCLLVRARHLRNFDEFRGLVRQHQAQFSRQPAMLAMIAEADAFFAATRRELQSVIEKARAALKHFDGVGLRLLAAEKLLELAQAETPDGQKPLLAEAELYVDQALSEYPGMPRYLAVKALIMARRGHFADARATIAEAMSLEDSTHSQYFIRLAKYESVRSEIVVLESSSYLLSRLDDAIQELNETRGNLFQVVGLLAAVYASGEGRLAEVKGEREVIGLSLGLVL